MPKSQQSPGSIPASSDTVEYEGRQMKQCRIHRNKKNHKNPPVNSAGTSSTLPQQQCRRGSNKGPAGPMQAGQEDKKRCPMDQISIKTPNPKWWLFLKINHAVKGLGGRCLRPPPLLGFVWGGKAILQDRNLVKYTCVFVGFLSGIFSPNRDDF
jgi:hypothetical protein